MSRGARKIKDLRIFSLFIALRLHFLFHFLVVSGKLRCAGCWYSLQRSGWQAYTEAPRSACWQLQDWCWDTDDHRFQGLSVFFHAPDAL